MPARPGPHVPLRRLVDSLVFERALRSRRRASTPHFAVHHVAVSETTSPVSPDGPGSTELSTKEWTIGARPVDDSPEMDLLAAVPWLGAVVPKRHARRAVTRSLLKRQIYAAAERHRHALVAGVWVVRLRAPFDRVLFPSAASEALKLSARSELETLFQAATGAAA